MTILFAGIDYHKNTCTISIVKKDGELIEKTTKKTCNVIQYLSNYKLKLVTIEASGGVNDFVDRLKAAGHETTIVNPAKFRLVGINGKKNDDKDSLALAEGARTNFIPAVHHKSKRSREIKSLLVSREMTVNSRVNMFNHIRGTLREYGITMPAGKDNFLKNIVVSINKIENAYIRNTLLTLYQTGLKLMETEKEIEERLHKFTKDDENIKRIRTIPGIGPLGALAFIAVVDDITRFPNSKFFASYLGLVPREHSSGDKRIMGSITRSGSEILRRYLIHGARAVMKVLKPQDRDANKVWAKKTKDRIGMNKATVALAHRLARIAFAIYRDGSSYGEVDLTAKNFSQEAA